MLNADIKIARNTQQINVQAGFERKMNTKIKEIERRGKKKMLYMNCENYSLFPKPNSLCLGCS